MQKIGTMNANDEQGDSMIATQHALARAVAAALAGTTMLAGTPIPVSAQ